MNSKVVKSGLGYTIGNYLLKGMSFITVPIFARLLTKADFGIYSTFVAYESILFIILGFAIHGSYRSAKYKYDETDGMSYASFRSTTMLLILLDSLLALVIVNVLPGVFESLLNLDLFLIDLLIIYSAATAVMNCFNVDASIDYNYKSYLTVSAINAILNLGISVALILTVYNSQRYMGRIIGTVAPMVILSAIIVIIFLRKAKPGDWKSYLKWGLSYSTPLIFHGLSQVVLGQFDRIMIRNMVGDVQTGIYSFAYTLFSIINVAFTSVDNVWSTWFYEKMHAGEYGTIRKYSSLYMLAIMIICMITILLSPELILLLGSSKYVEANALVGPIVAAGYFAFLYTLPACVEYYYEKTSYIAVATVAAAAINIGLNYIFISMYGYVAAAYTTLATYILCFVFHFAVYKHLESKVLFSVKTVLLSSALILASVAGIGLLAELIIVRWIMAAVLIFSSLYYEERTMGIVKNYIKKR